MKILYLHQYFNTPDMPGGTRSYEMARRLVANGHEVHMITTWRENDNKSAWFQSDIEGIHVHWFPVPYSNDLTYNQRIKAFFSYAFQAGRKAKKIGGDLVFATSTPLTISIPAVSISKYLGIPMVFEVRDLWPELPIAIGALKNPVLKYFAKKLEMYSYKNARHIIALSPGMAEGIIKTGYSKDNITIIPNSSDLDVFKPNKNKANDFKKAYTELDNSPLILYAGTLGIINGVGYLADLAYELFRLNSRAKIMIFGHGNEWNIISDKAKELGVLNKNFFMYKAIPKTELVKAFCAADISTSLFVDIKEMEANSANKFFDSLASGTPTAINYGGWHSTLLQKNNAGITLTRDTQKAAIEITDLLRHIEASKTMGINARRLAKEEFSRDILAKKLELVLINTISMHDRNIGTT